MKVDLHTHTIASGHAHSSLVEMAKGASEKGIEVLGITDHGPFIAGAPPVSYFKCGDRFPDTIEGVRILFGVEANIIDEDGNLDLPEKVLKKLDFVMAGFHDFEDKGIVKNTQAMIKTIKNPYVKMISHPYKTEAIIDIEKITLEAIKNNVLLEINASFFYKNKIKDGNILDNIKKMINILKKHNKKMIINSDAHSMFEIGRFDDVKSRFSELGISEGDLLNNEVEEVLRFFGVEK